MNLEDLKTGTLPARAAEHDVKVDMFSTAGFALACRVAKAFSTSDAVPAQFRAMNLKRIGSQEKWVDNPAAIGNCLVAMEVARAVGMAVTAVMQNADVIEGKLRWSDKFVVGGINASRRFTPLRFDVRNMGPIKATYREKTGWDDQLRRPVFTDKTVETDNWVSTAWALPFGFVTPAGVHTLDQARKAGLPVIEGPPVSMKLAVEEGWYGKPGSKWQTELKHKMLMMRSGRYFGDIHAPDIVMGIGRTTEDEREVIYDAEPTAAGAYSVDLESLRTTAPAPEPVQYIQPEPEPEPQAAIDIPPPEPAQEPSKRGRPPKKFSFASVEEAIRLAKTLDDLDVIADAQIGEIADAQQRDELGAMYRVRRAELM